MNFILHKTLYNFTLSLKQAIPRRLLDRQKPRQKLFTIQDRTIQYNPYQALQLLRVHSFTSFLETVEICIQLGVNPKIGDQMVRGSAFMPAGLGKSVKIAVYCSETIQEKLGKGIVDIFVNEQTIVEISQGKTDFDMLFTTPDLLPKLKPFGKVLGPRGLMPNPKMGTLINEKQLPAALSRAKAGQVNFRVDSGRNIHAQIGKVTFSDSDLLRNFKSLMIALTDRKPASLKGRYLVAGFIKTTMGPRWKLDVEEIDPRHKRSIWGLIEE